MQWWNDFVEWLYSDAGWRVISTVIVPFVTIIVAALIAVGITRGSISRLLARQDREDRAAAVAGIIEVARQSTQWGHLPETQREHLVALASAASIRLRLLSTHGATAAAEWSEYKIAEVRQNSETFSVQSDQDHIELRDRLVEWQNKPKAARRLFASDLERFASQSTSVVDEDRVEKQRMWAAEQAASEQEAAERAAALAAAQLAEQQAAAERAEAERLEMERAEAARLEIERAETERAEAERLAADQSSTDRPAENLGYSSPTLVYPPTVANPEAASPEVAELVSERIESRTEPAQSEPAQPESEHSEPEPSADPILAEPAEAAWRSSFEPNPVGEQQGDAPSVAEELGDERPEPEQVAYDRPEPERVDIDREQPEVIDDDRAEPEVVENTPFDGASTDSASTDTAAYPTVFPWQSREREEASQSNEEVVEATIDDDGTSAAGHGEDTSNTDEKRLYTSPLVTPVHPDDEHPRLRED